ncbi:SDR family oxidoreductase [Herbidospora galbida]|uniref:SDR family oxidoreductase n=1 Tax=Herbidospora galbida TaxID=2575442 RepID=A0A4U3MBK9_9ACTN|nr:SDR family oxidoreductase [Herbidospora galbida]TKK86485.1 SDR family oxidoreductase [Herbidospora galbida]
MSVGVVAVTGAAGGIGRAVVALFRERGARVVAVDVDGRGLDDLAGDDVATVAGDVSAEETNEAFTETALSRFGRLDAVVLNAGIGGAGPLESPGAVERFDRIWAVNVRGVALGVRAALPALRASGGGSVVVTSSISGLGGDPGTWAYNAAKAAVVNLVRGLALDHAAENVRINAIAPGGVSVGLNAAAAHPVLGPAILERIPQHRWSEAREQAEAIWFLSSPAASYITGVTLPVDGGLSANNGILLPPASRQERS